MSSVPFHYVDCRAFSHATEDHKRVEDALRTLLPEDVAIERASTEGYHGDRILVLSARVENADGVRDVLSGLTTLDPDALRRVRGELDERVDENCSFFLTLDKQTAYRGEVALGEGIVVRAKIEAYPADKDVAIENVRETLEDL